jgi:hypothetical protein
MEIPPGRAEFQISFPHPKRGKALQYSPLKADAQAKAGVTLTEDLIRDARAAELMPLRLII